MIQFLKNIIILLILFFATSCISENSIDSRNDVVTSQDDNVIEVPRIKEDIDTNTSDIKADVDLLINSLNDYTPVKESQFYLKLRKTEESEDGDNGYSFLASIDESDDRLYSFNETFDDDIDFDYYESLDRSLLGIFLDNVDNPNGFYLYDRVNNQYIYALENLNITYVTTSVNLTSIVVSYIEEGNIRHRILDLLDGTYSEVNIGDNTVYCVSEDGNYIACQNNDNSKINIFDTIKDEFIDEIAVDSKILFPIQFSEGRLLFKTYPVGIYTYNLKSNSIELIESNAYQASISPDSKYLAYNIFIEQGDSGHLTYRDTAYNRGIHIVDLESHDKYMLSGTYEIYNGELITGWMIPSQTEFVEIVEYNNSQGEWAASASTSLDDYDISYIIDGDVSTAWVENSEQWEHNDGAGIGEWVKVVRVTNGNTRFTMDFSVSEILLTNGYIKSDKTYYENNRIKSIEVELSNGFKEVFELDDDNMSMQSIKLENGMRTKYILVRILEVYPGTKYNDSCISELVVNE